MTIEFYQTGMGHRFFESTLPRIATALERLAKAVEQSLGEPVVDKRIKETVEKLHGFEAATELLADGLFTGGGDLEEKQIYDVTLSTAAWWR